MTNEIGNLIEKVTASLQQSHFSGPSRFPDREVLLPPKVRLHVNDRDLEPSLRSFLSALEIATEKKQYGKHTAQAWKDSYVFPLNQDINKASELYGQRGMNNSEFRSHTINKSEDDVDSWLQSYLDLVVDSAKHGDSNITFLCGGVGSGKSTFIRYLIATRAPRFVSRKVIPSRIEAIKVLRDAPAQEEDRDQFFHDYIKRRLVRDFILFHYGEAKDPLRYPPSIDQELVFREIKQFLDEQPDKKFQSDLHFQCNRFASNVNSNPANLRNEIDRISLPVVDAMLHMASRMGYVFVPIFDGFDRINTSDYLLSDSGSRLLKLLSDWMFPRFSQIKIETHSGNITIRLSPLVCARNNSWSYYLAQSRLAARAEFKTNYIIAPSLGAILAAAYKQLWPQLQHQAQDLHSEFLASLYKALTNENLQSADDVNGIFNDNVRFLLHYLQDVIHWMLRRAEGHEYMELFTSFLRQRWYRLFHILLTSDSKQFHNFITVGNPKPESRPGTAGTDFHYVDDPHHSGYIDNIFNYHISAPDSHALLDKIRVCNILLSLVEGQDFSSVTLLEICFEYKKRFDRDLQHPEATVAILIRAGFIAEGICRPSDRMATTYVIEPLGRFFVKQKLFFRLPYVEMIVSQTLFPSGLAQLCSRETRDPDERNVFSWTVSSMQNAIILYGYVKHIETTENVAQNLQQHPAFLDSLLRDFISLSKHDATYIPSLVSRFKRKGLLEESFSISSL